MNEHVISVWTRPDGMDCAEMELKGRKLQTSSRNGAIMAVARVACAEGAADLPWRSVGASDGRTRLYGASLHNLALFTVSDPDKGRARFVKFVAYDPSVSP